MELLQERSFRNRSWRRLDWARFVGVCKLTEMLVAQNRIDPDEICVAEDVEELGSQQDGESTLVQIGVRVDVSLPVPLPTTGERKIGGGIGFCKLKMIGLITNDHVKGPDQRNLLIIEFNKSVLDRRSTRPYPMAIGEHLRWIARDRWSHAAESCADRFDAHPFVGTERFDGCPCICDQVVDRCERTNERLAHPTQLA